jgi:hypothetical protein
LVAALESAIAAMDAVDTASFPPDGENRRTTASYQPAGYGLPLAVAQARPPEEDLWEDEAWDFAKTTDSSEDRSLGRSGTGIHGD